MSYYRFGEEVFLSGNFLSTLTGECARCLEEFSWNLETPARYVLIPRREAPPGDTGGDAELDYYETDEIDLSPLVRERILLSLPSRALCDPDCRGLCASCGRNLNEGRCDCVEKDPDPRLAIFRTLKVGR